MNDDIIYGLSEISLYLTNIGREDFAQTVNEACKKLDALNKQKPVKCNDCKYSAHYIYCYPLCEECYRMDCEDQQKKN